MRVPRLAGTDGSLLKCPSCRLKLLRAAATASGQCPRCGHSPLLSVDAARRHRNHSSRPGVIPSMR